MKPECEKRLAVVIGGVRDHGARPATCATARRLSGRRVGVRSTSVARLHSRALPGMEGRAGREKGRTVVAPKGERIACGRMSPRRPRSESKLRSVSRRAAWVGRCERHVSGENSVA